MPLTQGLLIKMACFSGFSQANALLYLGFFFIGYWMLTLGKSVIMLSASAEGFPSELSSTAACELNLSPLHAQSLQSCPTLCDPVDCNPPGSSVCGILQARILEWVAVPSSKGFS